MVWTVLISGVSAFTRYIVCISNNVKYAIAVHVHITLFVTFLFGLESSFVLFYLISFNND